MTTHQPRMDAAAKRDRIVSAAADVFLRYGHARTTMGDIAEKAAISRPALYLVFPDKDEIFAAVIAHMWNAWLAKTNAALAKHRTLDRKLHYVCESWAGEGYDITAAHPDARDVFNLAFEPVRVMYDELQSFIADLIRDVVKVTKLGINADEIARVLIFSLRGLKDTAKDAPHMRRLIRVQVELVLRAIEG